MSTTEATIDFASNTSTCLQKVIVKHQKDESLEKVYPPLNEQLILTIDTLNQTFTTQTTKNDKIISETVETLSQLDQNNKQKMILTVPKSQEIPISIIQTRNQLISPSQINILPEAIQANLFDQARLNYLKKLGCPLIKIIYGQRFDVHISTKNLEISAITKDDAYLLHKYVWGQHNTMRLFANGKTKTLEETQVRVNGWVKRWENFIPYSGMTIKNKYGHFIGYIVMGFGDGEGNSEIAYMIKQNEWNKGYGYESVGALSLFLSKILIKNNFGVNKHREDLKRVIATAHTQNKASNRILEKCGFEIVGTTEKFGFVRYEHTLTL